MKTRIKKNDLVYVMRGRSAGQRQASRVLAVFPKTGRALVEGVNMVRKHQRARSQTGERGIIEKEAPIDLSNVMAIDSVTNEPTRIRMKINEDGTHERVSVEGNPIRIAR
ncbi:50S ribosomal protein L24 [Candidatus Sumerlaeota bacterium]|nr:50S ribosomal protein L24 [Candidatus Sumerlaeota bacterium]